MDHIVVYIFTFGGSALVSVLVGLVYSRRSTTGKASTGLDLILHSSAACECTLWVATSCTHTKKGERILFSLCSGLDRFCICCSYLSAQGGGKLLFNLFSDGSDDHLPDLWMGRHKPTVYILN